MIGQNRGTRPPARHAEARAPGAEDVPRRASRTIAATAACVVVAVVGAQLLAGPLQGVYFAFPLAAVAVLAVTVGQWPGLLATATIMAALAAVVIEPRSTGGLPPFHDTLRLLAFAISGVVISFAAGAQHRARARIATERARALAAHAERARAEEDLRRAHSLIDGITRGTDDMIAAQDDDFRYLFFNEAYRREFARLWGRELEVGTSMVEAMAPWPEEQRKAVDLWSRALAGESSAVTMEFGPTEHERQVYDVRFNPVVDANGERQGAAHILRNVTEQVRTQRALAESEVRLRDTAIALQRANEQLRQNAERHRLVSLATHDVLWDWDLKENTLVWNEAIETTFGHPLADVPPEVSWWSDNIHPEDRPRVVAAIRAVIDDPAKRFWSSEYRFRHRQGHWIDVLDRGFVARDGAGRGVRIIGSMLDMTGRKEAEEALQESRDTLQAVLDAAPVAIVVADAHGRIAMASAATEVVLGGPVTGDAHGPTRGYRLSRPDGASFPPGELPLARALAGETVVAAEILVTRADGTRATVLASANPLRSGDGSVRGAVSVLQDITARKQAEEALRESQQLLQSTMDHFPTVIAFKDTDGRFLDVNRAVEDVLGLPKEQIRGRTMHDFVPEEAADVLARHDLEVMQSRRPMQREEVTPLPGGTLYHLNTNFPLIDAEGRVYGTGHISHDITALRRAEEAQRVANDKLREADRRKDDFLGMLSHELRNPLAPIRNSLYVLDNADPTGQQARRAKEVVKRQVGHLTRLVDDLLDVTRIARGKVELRRTALDVAELVRRAGDDHRALMRERGIELVIDVPREPLWVDGDETRLAQVLGNLLQNAAKFTPAGGRVTLAADLAGNTAEIRVRDTGAGIDPELLERVFEPFTQAEQTLARTEGGLGLGLALVKGLVAQHGGTVTASSAGRDQGTEFTVRLPARATAAPAAQARTRGSRASGQRRRRVLVVDDNRDGAEMLGELVRMLGHDAEVVFDGPSAVEAARRTAHDVVLCDIGLPGMSGYDVARALRSHRVGGMQLVAVSGYAQPEDLSAAAEAGFDRHIAKPPDPAEIEQLLG